MWPLAPNPDPLDASYELVHDECEECISLHRQDRDPPTAIHLHQIGSALHKHVVSSVQNAEVLGLLWGPSEVRFLVNEVPL